MIFYGFHTWMLHRLVGWVLKPIPISHGNLGMNNMLAKFGRERLKQTQQCSIKRCYCSYTRTPQQKIDLKTKNFLQENALVLKTQPGSSSLHQSTPVLGKMEVF